MNKILNIEQSIRLAEKLHKQNKTIVLAGGCFDILHIGHVEFLKKAKKIGDYLFVLLESDESIHKKKGEDRPINTQQDRASVLAALKTVDFVVKIPQFETNQNYDDLITKIKPDTIATTKGDPHRIHKERQGELINSNVVDVIEKVPSKSTSKLLKLILEDYWI